MGKNICVFKEINLDGVDWIREVLYRDRRPAVVKAVMNIRVS